MDILEDSLVKDNGSSFDKKTLGNHPIGSPALQGTSNGFELLKIKDTIHALLQWKERLHECVSVSDAVLFLWIHLMSSAFFATLSWKALQTRLKYVEICVLISSSSPPSSLGFHGSCFPFTSKSVPLIQVGTSTMLTFGNLSLLLGWADSKI